MPKKITGPKPEEKEELFETHTCSDCGEDLVGAWKEIGRRKVCFSCHAAAVMVDGGGE